MVPTNVFSCATENESSNSFSPSASRAVRKCSWPLKICSALQQLLHERTVCPRTGRKDRLQLVHLDNLKWRSVIVGDVCLMICLKLLSITRILSSYVDCRCCHGRRLLLTRPPIFLMVDLNGFVPNI
jgi:hypothetical protein